MTKRFLINGKATYFDYFSIRYLPFSITNIFFSFSVCISYNNSCTTENTFLYGRLNWITCYNKAFPNSILRLFYLSLKKAWIINCQFRKITLTFAFLKAYLNYLMLFLRWQINLRFLSKHQCRKITSTEDYYFEAYKVLLNFHHGHNY